MDNDGVSSYGTGETLQSFGASGDRVPLCCLGEGDAPAAISRSLSITKWTSRLLWILGTEVSGWINNGGEYAPDG